MCVCVCVNSRFARSTMCICNTVLCSLLLYYLQYAQSHPFYITTICIIESFPILIKSHSPDIVFFDHIHFYMCILPWFVLCRAVIAEFATCEQKLNFLRFSVIKDLRKEVIS